MEFPGSTKPATVMAILNITPDSFSDGGRHFDPAGNPDQAVAAAQVMRDEGADIIDIGGESTRPGSTPVSPADEMARVLPVIEAVADQGPVAIDTRSEEVARAAVAAGATIINDVGASLGLVAAELGVGWVAMHMQGEPATMHIAPTYDASTHDGVVGEILHYLVERAEAAAAAGCERIWIDPGFGFGKTLDHNLDLLANIDRFVDTGWPVAVGTSRKGMLGHMLARSDGADQPVPVDDRLVGSVTTATYAMLAGVDLVRVHDVKPAKQAATVVAGSR